MNGDGLTPRRPPPLHSSTINTHQRHEPFEELTEAGGATGVLLRLQRRLRQLEQENKTINEELEKGSNSSTKSKKNASSAWHLDQLEMEKLKNEMKLLREQILKGDEQAAKEQLLGSTSSVLFSLQRVCLAQFDALNAELEHRRREQLEMKSKLQERVMQHENETDDVIANDAIEQAYQSQKQINKSDTFSLTEGRRSSSSFRMLELELEQCRTSYQREYQRTQERLTLVEQENLDLCKSIDENTIDDAMKQQISSVINENLVNLLLFSSSGQKNIRFPLQELHQQIQTNHAEIRKLRRVIKLVNKSFSAGNVSWEQVLQNGTMDPLPTNPVVPTTTSSRPISSGPGDLRRQSTRHFSGMIKCNPQETERITDAVIIGAFPLTNSAVELSRSDLELKPRLAAKYIPGLPAYILFMCIRYIDFVDDEAHVAGFLSAVTKKIKKLPRVTFRSIRAIEETFASLF